MAMDSGVDAGTWAMEGHSFWIGWPSTKDHSQSDMSRP